MARSLGQCYSWRGETGTLQVSPPLAPLLWDHTGSQAAPGRRHPLTFVSKGLEAAPPFPPSQLLTTHAVSLVQPGLGLPWGVPKMDPRLSQLRAGHSRTIEGLLDL